MDLENKVFSQMNLLIDLENQICQQHRLQEQLQLLLYQQQQLQEEIDAKINFLRDEIEATRASISNI